MSNDPSEKSSGYGNIYTPHAGSMIIHVQRESGLANRTIILTQRQVRLLRRGFYTLVTLVAIGAASWFYLAAQAARVPFLTRRVATLQKDATRIDTLENALTTLEGRFQQVQKMLGAAPMPAATPASPAATPVGTPTTAAAAPSTAPPARSRRSSSPRTVTPPSAPATTPPAPRAAAHPAPSVTPGTALPDSTAPSTHADSSTRTP